MSRFIDSIADYGNEISNHMCLRDYPVQTLHERFCYSMAGRAGWLGTFRPTLAQFSHKKWAHYATIVNQFAHYLNSMIDPGESCRQAEILSEVHHDNRSNIREGKPFEWKGFDEKEVMAARSPNLSVAEDGPEAIIITDPLPERSEVHKEPDINREKRHRLIQAITKRLGIWTESESDLRCFDQGAIRFPVDGPRQCSQGDWRKWYGTTSKKLKYVIFSTLSAEMQWRPRRGWPNDTQLCANHLVRHLRYFFQRLKARGLGAVQIIGVCPVYQFGQAVAIERLEEVLSRKS